jgi:hypothetical protein
VAAADGGTRGDVVTLGELVLDRDVEAGEGVPVDLHHFRESLRSASLLGVDHVVGSHDGGQGVEVALRGLLEAVAHRGLVRFTGGHPFLLEPGFRAAAATLARGSTLRAGRASV